MVDLSVIICSRNPRANFLRRTLGALQQQTLAKDRWELILVDNASEPALASSFDLEWHPNAHHIVEPKVGLAPARRRGILTASADLLIFVDDDNLLDFSYLSEALTISRKWERLGVFGSGCIIPEFEHEPATHLKRFIHYLALRRNARDCWSNVISCGDATPWGAGLCIRAELATAYCEFDDKASIKIIDRQGQTLISGQDVEMSYVACSRGFGMGTFVNLKLTHLIPRERVTEEYLLRMVEGQEFSNALLAYKWSGTIPRSPFSLGRIVTFVKTVVVRQRIDRRAYLANFRAIRNVRCVILANERMEQEEGSRLRPR